MKVKNINIKEFDEQIKEISIKVQDIMKEIDYLKKVSQLMASEIQKTLVISYM
jgi:hypothetical protein